MVMPNMTGKRTISPLGKLLVFVIDHRGKTPRKIGGNFSKSGIPVLSAKNIKGGRIDLSSSVRYVTRDLYDKWMPQKLQRGDILLTSEAPLGEVAYLSDETEFCLGQRLFALRVDPKQIDSKYLYYYLQSAQAQYELRSRATGTTAQGIRQSELLKIRVEFPTDIVEQRAIAHILGTLDDKIELLRRMSETLEEMARAIFKAWSRGRADGDPPLHPGLPAEGFGTLPSFYDLFPDRLVPSELGEIPEGWRVGTLAELSYKPQYGYTASAKDHPVGPKFLRIKDINKLPWIEWASVPYCEIPDSKIEQYQLHPGDVLIARMADPGHGVVIEEEVGAVFASYLIRFRLRNLSYARYIQYWLRSEPYWELVRARLTGTTRPNLNARVIGAFPLIIPSEKVVSVFGDIVASLRRRVVRNVKEMHTLAALRDALLPKLIRGEIRVKDAERFLERVTE